MTTAPGEVATDRRTEFAALLEGAGQRRFLTSAWQHFVGEEYDPDRFVAATVDFNRRWDWDWVKLNPRAVYYSEAWGARFDPDDYAGVVPKLVRPAIGSVADLAAITALDVTTNPAFAEHLATARTIAAELDDRAVLQTVFSPLTVLLQLAGLPLYPTDPVPGAAPTITREQLLTADPAATHAALDAIATTLAGYVAALVAPVSDGGAGLEGIFYAVTGTASTGNFSREEFDALSRPYDLKVLAAATAADAAVVFHTCRADSHPDWFADYPIDALHWDQFLPGNPPLTDEVLAGLGGVTGVGGVNSLRFGADPDLAEVDAQLAATLASGPGRGFLLAPSCTIPTPADSEALRRLRNAH